MKKAENAILDAARRYVEFGWPVVSIPAGKKSPKCHGWQNLRLAPQDLAKHFNDGNNVGGLLGVPPLYIADIDLDCREAVTCAKRIAGPRTDRVAGRSGNPTSHYFFTTNGDFKTKKFEGPNGEKLLEVRGTGAQTVLPPSRHPEGGVYSWEREGDFGRATIDDLILRGEKLAAAALLARHWPGAGSRHSPTLALAGALAVANWVEEHAIELVLAVAEATGDPKSRDREGEVRSTFRKVAEGDRGVTQRRHLEEMFGEEVVALLVKWLRLDKRSETAGDERYVEETGKLCIVKYEDDERVVVPLCNFTAKIHEHVTLDDGVEPVHAHLIGGRLETGRPLPNARVPSTEFGLLNWVTKHWAAHDAIVRAGWSTRDQLREAIQTVSQGAPSRHIFTHTGWREVSGHPVFLHAGGALGGERVEVELSPELARYRLPLEPEDAPGAMRDVLNLLYVAPLAVTVPLFAAMFRAAFASLYPLDVSLWLEGATGSMKSTLAALFLCLFGDFTRTSLPGTWSSTANQLEKRAFTLKDVPLVIDDFAPSPLDARELDTKAARLLRSQGNLAGRARLRSDLSERPAYPPRGFIISTGEQRPPGQSLLARMVVVEVDRSEVNLERLTAAQRAAGRFPHAMAGFLLWAGARFGELQKELATAFDDARRRATADGEHLRVPEAIANLWLGFDYGLRFAENCGACAPDEAAAFGDAAWATLLKLGRGQGKLVEQEKPSRRFLSVLFTLLTQHRAVLLDKKNRESSERQVGWKDAGFLYLMPEAAFQAVAQFCRDSGEPFVTRPEALRRDLAREGLLELDEGAGRYTRTVRIGEKTRKVLQLRRTKAEELIDGTLEEAERQKKLL